MTRNYFLILAILFFSAHQVIGQKPFHYRTTRDLAIEAPDNMASSAVKQTTDNGFVAFTNASTLSILKFDSTGKLTWSYDFSPGQGVNGIQVRDGGYAAVGNNGANILVVRTNSSGSLLWARTYSAGISGNWIQQTLDNGFIIGGYAKSGAFDESVLIKTDSAGNVKWTKQWSQNSNHVENLSGVQLSDSTYVFGGGIGYTSPDGIILMKTDKNGNLLWNKVYQMSGISYTFSMRATRDKGFILTGTDNSPIWHVLKTDSAGNVQWSKRIYPQTNQPYGYCMDVEQLDYGYAVAGWFYSFNPVGYSTSYLVKLDPTGKLLWNRTYTDTYWCGLYSVKQTIDKGLVAYGYAQDTRGWGELIKTDSTGLGGCATPVNMVDTDYTFTVITTSLSLNSPGNAATLVSNTYSGAAAQATFICSDTATGPAAGFIASDTSICTGGPVSFTDQSTGSPTGWKWTFTGGTPGSTNQQNPTVIYSTPGTYDVKLWVGNSGGADSLTKTGYITVKPGPVPGNITGPAAICAGDTALLSDTAATGALVWQVSYNDTQFYVTGDTSANGNFGAVFYGTYYRVIATNGCGTDSSAVFKLTVNPLPAPVITAADTLFCSGDSASLCTGSIYQKYVWNTSDTTHCTTVNAAGGYWVTVTDTNHCSAVSLHQQIHVYPVPSVSIIQQGDTLSSFGQVSYQWIRNSVPIDSATRFFYVAHQAGSYAVQVTDTNGCITTSEPVIISGIQELEAEGQVSVYPNPSNDNWQLKVDNSLLGSVLEVYDEQGRLIEKLEVRSQKLELTANTWASGIYYLRISSGDVSVVRKLVKM